MEIRLKPEHEAMVMAGVASGRCANVEEYLAEAIELFDLRLAYDEECRLLDESIAQGERGEVYTKEQVEREMDELRAESIARHRPME